MIGHSDQDKHLLDSLNMLDIMPYGYEYSQTYVQRLLASLNAYGIASYAFITQSRDTILTTKPKKKNTRK